MKTEKCWALINCWPCQLHRSVSVQMGLAKEEGRTGRAGRCKSVELCNEEVAQAPPHRGRLAVQGRARFGSRSNVPVTNSFISDLQPHKDPQQKDHPVLPALEKPHYIISQSVCVGMGTSLALRRFSILRTLVSAPGHMVSWPRRTLVQCR